MKKKKKEMSLEERVRQNRESLKKQDAWAYKVAKKDHMERVTIEECRYGGGWIAGRKEERRVYCGKFADSGLYIGPRERLRNGYFPDVELMVEAYTGYSEKEIRAGKRDRELDEISPLSYIRGNFPPTFMIYGSLDSLRFNTFEMQKLMKTYRIPHEVYCGGDCFTVSTPQP